MTKSASILYRGFWDVPRIFLFRHDGKVFLFECLFNEELDDYPDDYQVHLLPANLNFDDLPNDWTTLLPMSIQHLGSVPVIAVKFDQTLRKEIDLAILELLPTQQTVSVAKSA
jgi:hypothetical protein